MIWDDAQIIAPFIFFDISVILKIWFLKVLNLKKKLALIWKNKFVRSTAGIHIFKWYTKISKQIQIWTSSILKNSENSELSNKLIIANETNNMGVNHPVYIICVWCVFLRVLYNCAEYFCERFKLRKSPRYLEQIL